MPMTLGCCFHPFGYPRVCGIAQHSSEIASQLSELEALLGESSGCLDEDNEGT